MKRELIEFVYDYIDEKIVISKYGIKEINKNKRHTYRESPSGDITYYFSFIVHSTKDRFNEVIENIKIEVGDENFLNYSEKYNYINVDSFITYKGIDIELNYKNIQEREEIKTIEIHSEFTLTKEQVRSDKINEILE